MIGVMTSHDSETSPENQGIKQGVTQAFTMKEAADVAGVSVSTLRRRRDDLEKAGAVISESGWQVPMTALIACGLIKTEGPGREDAGRRTLRSEPDHDETEALRAEIQELRESISEWQRRAEVAEAVSRERAVTIENMKLSAETERMALRMITSGQSGAQSGYQNQSMMPDEGPSRDTRQQQDHREHAEHGGLHGVSDQVSRSSQDTHMEGSNRETPPRKGFFGRLFS